MAAIVSAAFLICSTASLQLSACLAILAMALTYLGQKLNVDIYLASVIVFVGRMFNNLGTIRRFYVEKFTTRKIVAKAEAVIEQVNNEEKKK